MKPFKGSVNDFLIHCSNLDSDQIEKELEYEQAITQLCAEHACSREEAIDMLESAKTFMVQQILDKLVNEGLVKQEFGPNGEALYVCTEAGHNYVAAVNSSEVKDEKPKKRKKRTKQ